MFNNLDHFPAEYDHIFNFGLIRHYTFNSLSFFWWTHKNMYQIIIFHQIKFK